MLSFSPAFSLFSFALIQSFFRSSSLSAVRVISSPYLRLLIFLLKSWFQLIIHPTWHFAWCALFSSSPELCMMPAWHFSWCTPTDLFIHTISTSPYPCSTAYTHRLASRSMKSLFPPSGIFCQGQQPWDIILPWAIVILLSTSLASSL